MKTKLFFAFIFVFFCATLNAQLAIWTTPTMPPIDPCTILDVTATNKGVLLPRLTLAERATIPSPKQGLLIYNSDGKCFNYFDGTSWVALVGSISTTQVPIIRTYTTDDLWTKPAGLKYIIVEMVGGGGGGGGCREYGGGAGAGAGYSKKIIANQNLLNSESISIGIGGLAGEATANGLNGGSSFFGSHCSATGGEGGHGQASGTYSSIGSFPGNGINGDINITGNPSGGAVGSNQTLYCGGSSFFGGGAPSNSTYNSSNDGLNASGYGSGGSGGIGISNINRKGGNGSGGIIIITEYY